MTAKEKYMSTIYSAKSLSQFKADDFIKESAPAYKENDGTKAISKLEQKIFGGQPFANQTNKTKTIELSIDNLPMQVKDENELKRVFSKAHIVNCST